ncbi:MAG TPA: HAMP domain-containing sensor histidine kinase [Chloroflexota bacterium]|nr:HAMP domain-containing sensor histidine kinase [Chloroflexota bacterium]
MTAQALLQYLSWALFVTVFGVTLVQAVRHPRRSTIDPTLLFGVVALIIVEAAVAAVLPLPNSELLGNLTGVLLMALPYLLLRLVEDFAHVPGWLRRAGEAGLILSVVCIFAILHRPVWLNLLLVAYFVALTAYCTVAFVLQATHSGGVTQRRLTSIALGSGFLALDLLIVGLLLAAPGLNTVGTALSALCGLGSGVGYYLGFAPPGWLRRAWQAPELRDFLSRASILPRLPDTQAILRELEHGTARSVGAEGALIGLWDEQRQVLLYPHDRTPPELRPPDSNDELVALDPSRMLAGEVLRTQRALFAAEPAKRMPAAGPMYRAHGTRNLLVAPITAGDQRLGVLTAYARTTIFAEEDLELLGLIASQAAVILESRKLIDEGARVQAREEAARLKDDFLSAAAHDLKSPLTSILGQAQRLQRQARRDVNQVDLQALDVIADQSGRLRALVEELLDATRVERRALSGIREPFDIVAVLRDVCDLRPGPLHCCHLDASEPLIGSFDVGRLRQLFENLVENAIKYSPEGGDVNVRAWNQEGAAAVTVSDTGIGIDPRDLPHLFERFRRGSNVDDRRFPGMGLGLYICRGIVEEHCGGIWATSVPGEGTTVHVTIPLEGRQPE